MSILITNANVWSGSDFQLGDVIVRDGKIANIALPGSISATPDFEVIDAKGKSLLPGLVDLHVHFRQPGFSYKETIATGAKAAAHGGFTTVCTMPNLNPAPDSPENIKIQLDIIHRDADINILPYATITRERKGRECVDFDECAALGIAGFSDDGSGIQQDEVMQQSLTETAKGNYLLAAHCEVNRLLNGGYIHDGEYARSHGHRGICSESEWREIERNISLAKASGARLHICHISTAESVDLIRNAKKEGIRVSCETAPHYLTFCDEDLREDGRFKMNPPLRSHHDKEALLRGIADGTIDVIATDHAPHAEDEKNRGLEKSAMGVVGIETSLAASYTALVKSGVIPMKRLIELMADNGRTILGIESELVGGIRPGAPASVTLVDFNEDFIVDPSQFISMGKSTPFEGERLFGMVYLTLCNGRKVYSHESLSHSNMNRDCLLSIKENVRIAPKTWKMVLTGNTSQITCPGQFVNLKLNGKFLRRPISVGDYTTAERGELTLYYDVVGEGTAILSEMKPEEKILTLTGLGNGFNVEADTSNPALVGGGIGVAPLMALAKALLAKGKRPVAFLGFNTAEDVVLEKELSALGIPTVVSTADGTAGIKGFVTDAIALYETEHPGYLDYFYACGPIPMLKALSSATDLPGELSLDERMGCGFGACMCCSVMTADGARSICKDGPVFGKEQLIWK